MANVMFTAFESVFQAYALNGLIVSVLDFFANWPQCSLLTLTWLHGSVKCFKFKRRVTLVLCYLKFKDLVSKVVHIVKCVSCAICSIPGIPNKRRISYRALYCV